MTQYVDPERDPFAAFKALPRDEPVMMLNLIEYRGKAVYDDGRDATGAEAYAAYGRRARRSYTASAARLSGAARRRSC